MAPLLSWVQAALGNLGPGFVAFAVVALMGAVALTLAHRSSGALTGGATASVAGGETKQVTCGGPGQATCSTPGNVWIPLPSTSPGGILDAVRKSALFMEPRADEGDHARDLSRLGTPVFVQALQPGGGSAVWPDFYVVPILDGHGNTTDAAEAQLNPSHTAIHVIAIVTYATPRQGGAIAQLPANAAVAALETRAHTSLRAGVAPELVYFPADAKAQQTGAAVWQAGGEFPADPLWLLPGADGQEHVVGDDGAVNTVGQLPMIHV